MKKMFSIFILAALTFVGCTKDNDEVVADLTDNSEEIQKVRIPQNRTDGYNGGLFWTVYKDQGTADMTFPSAGRYPGNFNLSYNNTRNIVGGKGWKNGSARRIGYNIGALSGNWEFVGVYGWTQNPDVEYYIVEKGQAGTNYANQGYIKRGKPYTVNGRRYQLFARRVANAPCALRGGNCNFWQYKSVRLSGAPLNRNQNIDIAGHARVWRNRGNVGLGQWTQYQVFGIEAYSGNSTARGRINATVWQR